MTEALLAVGVVLVLAIGAAALRAVLDGRVAGAPASITVLAPAAEVARLLRRRGAGLRARFGGLLLLAAAGAQLAVLLGAPLWWLGATAILRWAAVWTLRRLCATGRAVVAVLLIELVFTAAVAAPVLATGEATAAGIAGAQQPVWFAVTMPVAFLAFVVASAATWGPLSVAVERGGGGSVLVLLGRALLLASAVALAVPLFLGGGAWPLLLAKAAILMVWVILVGRRFPRLGARTLPLRALSAAVVLALLQVAVVESLTQLR